MARSQIAQAYFKTISQHHCDSAGIAVDDLIAKNNLRSRKLKDVPIQKSIEYIKREFNLDLGEIERQQLVPEMIESAANNRHDDEQHMRNGQSKSYRCPILLGFPPWLCSSTSLKRIIRCTIFARRGLPGCRVLASHGQACPCTHRPHQFSMLVIA